VLIRFNARPLIKTKKEFNLVLEAIVRTGGSNTITGASGVTIEMGATGLENNPTLLSFLDNLGNTLF
jgi:hypothetical protein